MFPGISLTTACRNAPRPYRIEQRGNEAAGYYPYAASAPGSTSATISIMIRFNWKSLGV